MSRSKRGIERDMDVRPIAAVRPDPYAGLSGYLQVKGPAICRCICRSRRLGQRRRRLRQSTAALARQDGQLGGLLEGFVAMEIARQLTWSEASAEMYHYRTKDDLEVDLVLETPSFEVVASRSKRAPRHAPRTSVDSVTSKHARGTTSSAATYSTPGLARSRSVPSFVPSRSAHSGRRPQHERVPHSVTMWTFQ